MAFFGLFKSTEQRELESKVRFRQGRHRIQKFIQQLGKNSEQYYSLARQAYRLGDDGQFRQMAGGYLQARETINRWERYLLKLEALEMRRGEVEATSDFLGSMTALTHSILRGASVEDVHRMQLDMAQALEKSQTQEEMLTMVMDATASTLDGAEQIDDNVLKQLCEGMELSPEAARSQKPDPDDADLDDRIEHAIRELQNAGQTH